MADLPPRESQPDAEFTAAGTPRRGRTARLAAAGVLLTVALAGAAAGVAFDRYVLIPHRFEAQRANSGEPRRRPDGRGGRRDRFHEQLARMLGLTAEQRVQLDSVMSRQERDLRAAHAVVQPRVDSIVASTRRQLDSILTPEQREKLRDLRESGGRGGAQGSRRRGPSGRPTP